jgi:hypothetical protein
MYLQLGMRKSGWTPLHVMLNVSCTRNAPKVRFTRTLCQGIYYHRGADSYLQACSYGNIIFLRNHLSCRATLPTGNECTGTLRRQILAKRLYAGRHCHSNICYPDKCRLRDPKRWMSEGAKCGLCGMLEHLSSTPLEPLLGLQGSI